ncbi:MAG: elongation factor P [Microgenomates group bacterium Gr01-1014_16]|nr:MAG: elongation factor P [Microgenomates group bacterium Gr01-1014_16]
MSSVKAGNIAKGSYIMYKNEPHQVVKADFMAPGKGSPIMRVKMRSVKTGSMDEYTYKTNEIVEEADVTKKELQYLYKDAANVVFMDPRSYEQFEVPIDLVGDAVKFLIADLKVFVVWFDGKPIGVLLPPNVNLKIIEASDAVAGNTVNAPKKLAKTETGYELLVPLFVKQGETVIVDTTNGEYQSRAGS